MRDHQRFINLHLFLRKEILFLAAGAAHGFERLALLREGERAAGRSCGIGELALKQMGLIGKNRCMKREGSEREIRRFFCARPDSYLFCRAIRASKRLSEGLPFHGTRRLDSRSRGR